MTFQEALKKEKRWQKRILIIHLYHIKMIQAKKKWSLRDTAKKLSISLGQVSEAIKLSKAIMDDSSLELLTREDALEKIK